MRVSVLGQSACLNIRDKHLCACYVMLAHTGEFIHYASRQWTLAFTDETRLRNWAQVSKVKYFSMS